MNPTRPPRGRSVRLIAVVAVLAASAVLAVWGLQPMRVSSVSADGTLSVQVATLSALRELAISLVLRRDITSNVEISVTDRATGRRTKTTTMLWHCDMSYAVHPLAIAWHPDSTCFMLVYDTEGSPTGVRADVFRVGDGTPAAALDLQPDDGPIVAAALNSDSHRVRNAIWRAIDEGNPPLEDAGLCWQPPSGPKRAAGVAPEVPWVDLDACARGGGSAVSQTSAYNLGADDVDAQATWSDDGITIKVRARDGAHVPVPSARELARGDGLWIAFGPYVRGSGPSWQYPRRKWWVGLTDKGPEVRDLSPAAEAVGEVAGSTEVRCSVARGRDANGPRTSYEVTVPWEALGRRAAPAPPSAVGFALTLDDADPGDTARHWWFADLGEISEAAGQLVLLPPDRQ